MKKILAILLILVLISVAALTGCGGSDSASGGDQPESAQSESGDAAEDSGAEPAGADGLGNLLSGAYVEMMKKNEYLMTYKATMNFEGQSMDVEATIAVKGEDSAMISKGEGFETVMIFKDKRVYMIDHASKTVTSWAEAGAYMGDMETGTFETDGMAYLGSGREEGFVYEEYSTEGGNVKYYFDGKDLVRIRTKIEGQEMTMDIIEMSNKVPAGMFEIPAGYQLIEM